MTDCLFCKIVAGQVPATIVSEADNTLAFADIDPQAPTHALVITRKHYATAADVAADDPALLGEIVATAHTVAASTGIAETGYRLVFNSGADANQTVPHVHCHLLGGRPMTWPPG